MLDLNEYRLGPGVLPFDRVQRLGVEVIPAEARQAAREAASVQAFDEARKAGIPLLPRSDVGKPYRFVLTAADGRALKVGCAQGQGYADRLLGLLVPAMHRKVARAQGALRAPAR